MILHVGINRFSRSLKVTVLAVLYFTAQPLMLSARTEQTHILVLSSYHPSFPTYNSQIQAVTETFADSNVLIDVEFLDSKRFTTQTARQLFRDLLKYKFLNLEPYDGIITTDDNALLFIHEYQPVLFPEIPVVFCGVNDRDRARKQNNNPFITGVVEAVSMEETLELILKLFPQTSKIFAVADGTPSGRGDLATFLEYRDKFPQSVISLEEYSFEELGARVRTLPEDSALLLLSAYTDKNGKTVNFSDGLKVIRENASVPIFHLWEHGLGEGILGGKIISQYDQAKTAAVILKKILFEGEDIAKIPIIETSPNVYMFDNLELKRFGLHTWNIPDNSIVINQSFSYFRSHLKLITGVGFVVITQTMLIVFLFFSVTQNKLYAVNLKQGEANFKNLFNYAPVALLEEDFSDLKKYLDALAVANGLHSKKEMNRYLKNHPGAIQKCISLIRLLDANIEAIHLFEAESKESILTGIERLMPAGKDKSFRKQLCALFFDSNKYSAETVRTTHKGNTIWTNIHAVIAPPARELWDRVYVGLENISDSKEFQMQLEVSLQEKDVLLKEIHHRVNNNLALISSILNLEIMKSKNTATVQVLKESMYRIKTISLVHRKLYNSKTLDAINLHDYLTDLVEDLISAYRTKDLNVKLGIESADIYCSRELIIPLGLIINEIISNSLKHAFPTVNGEEPSIRIRVEQEQEYLLLSLRDNGKGFTPEKKEAARERQSMGLTIIETLLQQLKAESSTSSSSAGTAYTLKIPHT